MRYMGLFGQQYLVKTEEITHLNQVP